MSAKSGVDLGTIITVVILVGMGWFFFGGGMEKKAAIDLQNINNQVATDAVQQYEMAKRSGKAMDICVQAGFVSASYLQAKDEPNYKRWKQTETNDCARASQ